MRISAILCPILLAGSLIAQTTATTGNVSDALHVVNLVTQKYADAKSLHIEATQEVTHSTELSRGWSKMILAISFAPDNRYRYEGRGPSGAALVLSDGKTVWTYRYNENLFTEKPVEPEKPNLPDIMDTAEEGIRSAKGLRSSLARLGERLNSAQLLPEETLTINGSERRCIGVHYGSADLKKRDVQEPEGVPREVQEEGTYWIDKDRMVIVKIERRISTVVTRTGSTASSSQDEIMTIFPVVELIPSLPDSTFVFSPPAQAKLVGEFPTQKRVRLQQEALRAAETKANEDLLGKPAPDVELKTVDGEVVALKSYRGKPVLIDVWATWCGPCVAMIPELKKLSNDLSAQGIVFLSVDVADDADAAAKLLGDREVPWQNLHDDGNQMRAAFHTSQAVPWQILLDSEGKLAFYQLGEDVSKLRAAVAALGPQYSGILVMRSTPR